MRFHYLLPLGLGPSALLSRYLAPAATGGGTDPVIASIREDGGHIPFAVAPVKLAASLLTLVTGGSAGKEGPCAQIGGSLAAFLADRLALPQSFLGILAGLASVLSTRYLGLGMETLRSTLAGQPIAPEAFLLKAMFTTLTLHFGGSGGLTTPVLFVGATFGSALAGPLGADRATLAAMGMIGALAGAA